MAQTHSRMRVHSFMCDTLPVTVHISHFHGESGVDEYHLMVCPTEYADLATQTAWVNDGYRDALSSLGLAGGTAVLRRVFCSDLVNQAPVLQTLFAEESDDPAEACAVSWVCQPPAPPAKIALWAYHVQLPDGELAKTLEGSTLSLQRGELTHLWSTGLSQPEAEASYEQTMGILEEYESALQAKGLTVADHVQRTWFFVQNIDANYKGLVVARKEFFASRGLTADTHYIASTGIEGRSAEVSAKVLMDAYAIAGVRPEQIEYLSATEYLCPTHMYGVTFERGTAVAYQDRKHVFISGTASIDHTGSILHPGDVLKQLDRTLENIEALLQQAGATSEDICMAIIYVRDPSDIAVIQHALRERCGELPMQVVQAPVCRPGWLVEIECEAIASNFNPQLPVF